MLLLLRSILLMLCLVPAYSVRYDGQTYVLLSDGVDSVKFAYDAFVQFHDCLTNVNLETPTTIIPTVPQAKDDERHKVLQLLQKCYLDKSIVLTQGRTQIDCDRFIDATASNRLSFPEQNRTICISRCIDTSWDRVNVTYIQAEKISTPVKNTCQIDCSPGVHLLHLGKTATTVNIRGDIIPFRGNPNENQIKHIPMQSHYNRNGQTQRLTLEEERSQQRLRKNVLLLFAVAITLTISALSCLGARCYIIKRRQRATNNNVNSYVNGGNSDPVEFLTPRETSRLRAECQASNARYCFDPTSVPRAPLPPTTSNIPESNSLVIYTLRADGELEGDERDFFNTRAVKNNAHFLHAAGHSVGLINHLATIENNPGAYSHVTLKPTIFTAVQTDVKFNEPDRTMHSLAEQPFWQHSDFELSKKPGIKSSTSIQDGRGNDSYKIEFEQKLVDSKEKKMYAKLRQRTKRQLVDYNTWVRRQDDPLKQRTLSEIYKTTCRKKSEGQKCENNADQVADSEYTNSWIADQVNGAVGFDGLEDIMDVENTSCSGSGSDVYINTNCEDLLYARRGGSPPSKHTPQGRSPVRCMAMDDNRTVHGEINAVGKCIFSRLDDWRNENSRFVDLEDVDDESDSSEDRDIYLNTESDDLHTIRQRGVCPKRDMSSKMGDGSLGSKAGICKFSVKHNADDDRKTQELTTRSDLNVGSDDEFYFEMSQNVYSGEIHKGNAIESDNGIGIDSSDDIYNNTNMDDCSAWCSEDNINVDAACIIRCNNADLGSGFHATTKQKKNEISSYKEEIDCIKHEIGDYFDQNLVMRVNQDDEHFVNVCPQNYATNHSSCMFINTGSLGSSRGIDKVSDDSCHGDVVNNNDENDTVCENNDEEKSGLYFDVSQFYRIPLPSDVGRRWQDGGNRDDFCLDRRDHEIIVTGDDGGEDVVGPNYYAKNPHAVELMYVKDDYEDDEYFNVGYDNYIASVHDDRHSCADDSMVSSRDDYISKCVSFNGEPSQGYKYNKADTSEQSLKDQTGREGRMRPSPRKNSYFQLERDYL